MKFYSYNPLLLLIGLISLTALVLSFPNLSEAQDTADTESWHWMYSAYKVNAETNHPELCPEVPIFRFGTRQVHNYIAHIKDAQVSAVMLWHEIDVSGQVLNDEPLAVAKGIYQEGELVVGNISFSGAASGLIRVVIMVETNGDYAPVGMGLFRLGDKGERTDTPGDCPDDAPTLANALITSLI